MSKIIGEITAKFDDADKTFKVRRIPYSQQARLFGMIKALGVKDDGTLEIDGNKMAQLADFQIELCSLSLASDDGARAYTKEDVDEWGIDNVRSVTSALDAFHKSNVKTSLDHSGNS